MHLARSRYAGSLWMNRSLQAGVLKMGLSSGLRLMSHTPDSTSNNYGESLLFSRSLSPSLSRDSDVCVCTKDSTRSALVYRDSAWSKNNLWLAYFERM